MTARTLELENGKYTLTLHGDGRVVAERYREPWPAGTEQFVGNKMLTSLVARTLDAEAALVALAPARTLHLDEKDAEVLARFLSDAAMRELGSLDGRHNYTDAEFDFIRERQRVAHAAIDILRGAR